MSTSRHSIPGEHSVSLGQVLTGRYLVERALKRGAEGDTLLATDRVTGEAVVVKTTGAGRLAGAARLRLEHEARVLQDLDSPWIAPLLDMGQDGDVLFLAMRFVAGESLRDRLARGPLDLADALVVGRCLFGALASAHDLGVLHGDVKPANLIVTGEPSIEAATLVDFGFARSAHLADSLQQDLTGTILYMAPEQAGLLERRVDERADLYAAGIILFECLAGRAPFEGNDTGTLLRQHLSAQVPSLRGVDLRVPRALDEIVQRLLRKDPDDRYQSARGVVADLDAVAAALGRGAADPVIVVGSHDRRHTLTEPALAGRSAELATLEALFHGARLGRPALVLLEAESGGGKTRLLEEIARRVSTAGAWILRGQTYFQAAPQPLQLLGGVLPGILGEAEAHGAVAVRLKERLDGHVAALAEVVPELGAVLGQSTDGTAGPALFGEERSAHALVALLSALGSEERPAVVLLDDCQWADDLTLRLLERWLDWTERDDRPAAHTMVIASFRSEDVPSGHPLRDLAAPRLRLDALTQTQVSRLAASMAGSLPDPAIRLIQTISRGNPFMASAALRGLVESGTLVHDQGGWRFDETAAPQWSHQAATFLARRLDLVSPRTQMLCSAGAVLGKEFSLELAAGLAGLDPTAAREALAEGTDRRLLWAGADGTVATFAHDRLRDAFLERIDADQRAALHLRAAETIEEKAPARVFELAYHFDAAGHPARALPYAMEAGRQARARHLLELAEANYRIAERGSTGTTRTTYRRVVEELGQILMMRGRYEEAAERLERAASLASDTLARASIEWQLGDLAFKRGEVRAAADRIEGALRHLGERVPRRRIGFLLHLVWEVAVQLGHLVRRPRPPAEPSERDLLLARLYARLDYAWWFGRSSLAALWLTVRQLSVAERSAHGSELGHAYSIHGVGLSAMFPPFHRRGLAYTGRARALHEQLGDLWGQGTATAFHSVVLHAAGRYEEALGAGDEAIDLLERAGDPWERNNAIWHKALSAYRLGDLRGATELAQTLYQQGLLLGDHLSRAVALEVWAKATNGAVPADALQSALATTTNHVIARSALLQADGVRLLADGHPEEAAAQFRAVRRLMRATGTVNAYLMSALAWQATACRTAAQECSPLAPRQRRRLVRQARRAARRAVMTARFWPNDRPHALREAGIVAAMEGRERRARRLFDRSLAEAGRRKAAAERSATLAAKAQAGQALGWPGWERQRDEAEALRRAVVPSPSPDQNHGVDVADRYGTLLSAGRRITGAASLDELIRAVANAGEELLRAEHCTIVRMVGDQIVPVTGEDPLPTQSRTLLSYAATAKQAVVMTPEGLDSERMSDSIIVSGIRSALCAPLLVHGEPAAYLVATHRLVAGLFGEDEVRLANFVAALAGAAMEREQLQQEMRARVIAAQEEERARVARDLHDEIGQALTSVLVGVRLLERSFPGQADELTSLREMHAVATDALGQVQRLAFEMRPSVLDHGGLVAAVRRLAGEVAARHGVEVDVAAADLEEGERLKPELETTAYRVVQEALTNVVRHAQGSSCSVVLARHDRYLRVVIEDDGPGFDPQTVRSTALGLRGMAERAALIGGALQINSTPGQGATIILDAPW